jgi:hypothetical protein
VLEE